MTTKAPAKPKGTKPAAAKPTKKTPTGERLTLRGAAVEVLRGAKQPMTAKEVFAEIERRKLYAGEGKTPYATIAAYFYTHPEQFTRVSKGKFSLKK